MEEKEWRKNVVFVITGLIEVRILCVSTNVLGVVCILVKSQNSLSALEINN
jgi:hypothetical protein